MACIPVLLHSGLEPPHCLSNVGLATAAGDPIHHLGLLLHHQGVLHLGQHRAEGVSRSVDNIHAKLPADLSDIVTDPFCLVCLPNPPGGFGRGADEGTGVSILPQDIGEVVFFLLQSVLLGGDGSGSVEQALDQSPLDRG